jgi:hypothetical protein
MDRKQMCISNLIYKKPTSNEQKRMKNLLKYLTYRDSRDKYVPHIAGMERWVDHGMGNSIHEIAQRCDGYQSDHVLMFSLVMNPNPDLVNLIPHDEREQFVHRLTENTVEDFFDARGIDTGVEYSFVTHHRETDGEEQPGQHNPHTHVVLPGTYYDADEGRRRPLYFSRNKHVNHIDLLHNITQNNMTTLMDRNAGRDWEQKIDELDAIRKHQESIVYTESEHGWLDDLSPVWTGVRRSDETTSAAGVYGFTKNREGKNDLQFRPIEAGLSHEEAEVVAMQLKRQLREDARTIQQGNEPRPTLDF